MATKEVARIRLYLNAYNDRWTWRATVINAHVAPLGRGHYASKNGAASSARRFCKRFDLEMVLEKSP